MTTLAKVLIGTGVVWDLVSSGVGACAVVGHEPPQVLASSVLALLVVGMLLSSSRILAEQGRMRFLLVGCWVCALFLDIATSYVANRLLVGGAATGSQQVIVLGLTLLGSA